MKCKTNFRQLCSTFTVVLVDLLRNVHLWVYRIRLCCLFTLINKSRLLTWQYIHQSGLCKFKSEGKDRLLQIRLEISYFGDSRHDVNT